MNTEDSGMNEPDGNPETRVALFQTREIRRTLHNNEWWFVITDIIAALTDSTRSFRLLEKDAQTGSGFGQGPPRGGTICPPPCLGVCDGRWASEGSSVGTPRASSVDPVHPQPQGRTVQARPRRRVDETRDVACRCSASPKEGLPQTIASACGASRRQDSRMSKPSAPPTLEFAILPRICRREYAPTSKPADLDRELRRS